MPQNREGATAGGASDVPMHELRRSPYAHAEKEMNKFFAWLLGYGEPGSINYTVGEYVVVLTVDMRKIKTKEDMTGVLNAFTERVQQEYRRQGREEPSATYIYSHSRVTANVNSKLRELTTDEEEDDVEDGGA